MARSRSPDELQHERPSSPERAVAAQTRALVVGAYPNRRRADGSARAGRSGGVLPTRAFQERLAEAVGLAEAIDLEIVEGVLALVAAIRPATFLGKGKVEEIAGQVRAQEIGLVVMDCALSPIQQRNLEKAWQAKVIDRTGLILEIFGRRARTREGTLQVEHAHLAYQRSRLVRSWTHLERQRGGFGFLGGPGETQIEADRRLIQERMTRIERELEGVVRTRGLHRASRRKVPFPTVALVGYTNAGKSTLFNRLTRAEVLAEDMLFATLDPTSRATKLPHGATVILSDTVGFISDLPTMLIAAFRATLEDVIDADLLLHVRDVSHGESEAQSRDVAGVLRELGIDPEDRQRLVEVWNKSDLLDDDQRVRLANLSASAPDEAARPVLVSAVTGDGLDRLLELIEERVAAKRTSYTVELTPQDGAGLNWLYEQAEVLERGTGEGGAVVLLVRIAPEKEGRLLARFPSARAVPDQA